MVSTLPLTPIDEAYITLQISREAFSGEEYTCFKEWNADININYDEFTKKSIGRISLFVVSRDTASFYEMDGHSSSLCEFYEIINHEHFPDVEFVLLIDTVFIEPEFRGRNFGHEAVEQLEETFFCSITALKPFPIYDDEPAKSDELIGKKKLRLYWKKAKFKPFRRSSDWYVRRREQKQNHD